METIIGNSREYIFENILPKNGICAEIGVDDGFNAERILKMSDPHKLYLIDAWDWSLYRNLPEYYKSQELKDKAQKIYEKVVEKFKDNKKIEIIKNLSTEAVKQFEDNYFDWVYVDASHDFEFVKEDMEIWWPKIKQGGYLAGHDYNNNWVTTAVDWFLQKYNLELCYKGNQIDMISDWCTIKK